jgi:hypothetical protein
MRLLDAVAPRLAASGLDVVVAGSKRAYITTSGTGIARKIGYVDDADLPALYAGAAAFAMPSLYEGFGLPCLEAMAAGTPVVAADRAALPEACGDAALLADPDDADAFAGAILDAERVLPRVRLPGRFQRAGQFILDVAHNPASATVLAETLSRVRPPRPVAALVAIRRDKDWRALIQALAPEVDRFVLTAAPSAPPARAWDLAAAADFAAEHALPATAEPDFDRALRLATDAATTLVTGSFHTVGDAMVRLQLSPLGE